MSVLLGRFYRRLVTGTLLALVSAPAVAAADGLKIEDAIRLAVNNNERSRIAALRVQDAQGSVERARAGFLPSLNLGASGTQRFVQDRSGRTFTSAGTLTLTQPLFAPSAFPTYWQAGHTYEAEQHGSAEDRRVLAFDAARSFASAVAAQQVMLAAEQRLARARANLENAEARAEAQLASVNDATRARLEMATSSREVVQNVGNVKRALLGLGFLLGQDVEGTLEPPDHISEAALRFAGGDQLVKNALEQRGDLRALREQILAARESAKEPHYRMAPSVNLQAQFRADPAPLPTDRWHDETVTLNLTWPLFDGGARYGDRKSRLARAETAELQERLLRRNVETAVKTALVSLTVARDALRVAEDGVEAARKNSEETEILYRQGLARALELTDANQKRFDAETALASARLTLAQAYLDL